MVTVRHSENMGQAAENINYYLRGLELVDTGRHSEALGCIQEHLRNNPCDVDALNDAGAILHCLGKSPEAVAYLEQAHALKPESVEIIWNLTEAYLGASHPDRAAQMFDLMERMNVLNIDVINRAANMFLNQGRFSATIDMLSKSLELVPNQDVLKPMVETLRNRRPKITFFCCCGNDTKFLTEIYKDTQIHFPTKFSESSNLQAIEQDIENSDICWFEWCSDLTAHLSRLPKKTKNIVRLHRFEAYLAWPSQVNWENIDALVLVGNSYVRRALLQQVPDIEHRTRVITIPNGVNLEKFKFTNRQRGKNIACIGYLNMRKNPMFLLQCMQKLHYIDPDYKLYFAGNFQDLMLEQYMRHEVQRLGLEGTVHFDGWQDDIESWLSDKSYLVSGSIGESQGLGILEGMACGLKPVIHHFPGAQEIFDSQYLFDFAEQFCEQIVSDDYNSAQYREFVERRYPLQAQLQKINELFEYFENDITEQKQPGEVSSNVDDQVTRTASASNVLEFSATTENQDSVMKT